MVQGGQDSPQEIRTQERPSGEQLRQIKPCSSTGWMSSKDFLKIKDKELPGMGDEADN